MGHLKSYFPDILLASGEWKYNSISHPNTSISHHKAREKTIFADIIDAWLM